MTYSNTYSSPSSPTNFNPFSGMGMRKGGRPSLFPGSGDGSTLNLDFTTGVLDPRLTFSRASTATFVNSSGYVEYAAHNLYYNTNFATISTGTANPTLTSRGWSYVFSTGTAVFNTDGSVSMTAVNNRVGLLRSSGFAGTGRQLIFSVDITSVGDTGLPPSQLVNEGTKTNDAYYINGTLWTSGNVVGPCTLSFVFTSNPAGNAATYFGIGMSSNSTGIVTFANPRWGFYGGVNQLAYSPNTSATNANYLTAEYHAPRFDYSPTNIGEPRGLLIEGQGINISTRSEDFANADWTKDSSVGSTNADVTTVSAATPANGATVNQIVFSRIAGGFSRVTRSCVGTVTTAYTMSVWLRTVSGTANVGLRIGADPAGFKCAVTTTWKRFQYTYTLVGVSTDANAQIMLWENIVGTDLTATVYAWGCQVEAGSGASSYIPTGASQVTRNADFLLSASSSGAGRSNEFSLDDLAPGISALNEHTVLWTYGRDPNSKREYPASLYARTNANTERIDLRDFSGTTVEVGTQTRTVQSVTVGTASIVKIALAQSTSAYPSSAINGTSATLTSGVIDSALGLQWVQLCNSSAVGISFNPIWARQLKVYPTALTAAQLQTLTTL